MVKRQWLIVGLGVIGLGGLVWWFASRRTPVLDTAAALDTSGNIGEVNQGPSRTDKIVGLVASAAGTIASAAIGAGGSAVGGATTAGSVAATQGATAAATSATPLGETVATGGVSNGAAAEFLGLGIVLGFSYGFGKLIDWIGEGKNAETVFRDFADRFGGQDALIADLMADGVDPVVIDQWVRARQDILDNHGADRDAAIRLINMLGEQSTPAFQERLHQISLALGQGKVYEGVQSSGPTDTLSVEPIDAGKSGSEL